MIELFLSQIANILDIYAATLTKRADRDVFFMTTQGIGQLVQRSVERSILPEFIIFLHAFVHGWLLVVSFSL